MNEIIKKYAHDYRDMKMSQDELRVFLEHFSKELKEDLENTMYKAHNLNNPNKWLTDWVNKMF